VAERGLYITIAVVLTVTVLLGFWPFYAALPTGAPGAPGAHPVIYVHAAIFTGWLVVLAAQVVLVFRRRVATHRRIGRLAIGYAVLVLLTGIVTTFVAPAQHVSAGRWSLDEAAGFLILPIGDMLLFGAFFAAGIAYRRNRELHKRLMVLAAIALAFPGAARLNEHVGIPAAIAIWLLPLALAIAHDAVFRRRVERVYLMGAAVLLLALARIPLMEAESWLRVGRRLLAPFLSA
jgi:hypothetical protein